MTPRTLDELAISFPLFVIAGDDALPTFHFDGEQAFDYLALHQTRSNAESFLSQVPNIVGSSVKQCPSYDVIKELLTWFQVRWNQQQVTPCPDVLWDCPTAKPDYFWRLTIDEFLHRAAPRILEIQVRLLARVLTGELATYPVFVTR